MKRISKAIATELHAPSSRIDVFIIDEDYASWDTHKSLKAQVLGYRVYHESPDHQARSYQLPDGLFHLNLLQQRVIVRGLQGYGQIDWREGDGIVSLRGFQLEDGKFNDLRPLWNALQAIAHIRVKPGPKVGAGAKFKSREAWYAALKEHVLPRQKRITADEREFAAWLGCESPATLFKYMKQWGPAQIQDLRDGRF